MLRDAGWEPEPGTFEQAYLPGPAVSRPWTFVSLGVAAMT